MKDFIQRNFLFLAVAVGTLVLMIGGVFLFSKNGGKDDPKKVSDNILAPPGSYITSGIKDGKFLAASSKATVTLVEFGDYQCPACGAYNAFVDKILGEFAGKINFVFRDFAFLGQESLKAAEAAACANDQGKYWEYHEYLYTHQSGENKGAFAIEKLEGFAKDVGLDTKKFSECLSSGKHGKKVEASNQDAKTAGVQGTPTFFINGIKIDNPRGYDAFKKLIEDALAKAPIKSASEGPYHVHFDIKTYQNGTAIDFSLPKYQESDTNPLDPNIHFHDGEGKVAHVHAEGQSLKKLFDSFKLIFPGDTATNNLKIYVNGKLTVDGLNYVPVDLDRILVSYGPVNDANIQKQLDSLTDTACIYSEKCPERGSPPTEECVGGIGTECESPN